MLDKARALVALLAAPNDINKAIEEYKRMSMKLDCYPPSALQSITLPVGEFNPGHSQSPAQHSRRSTARAQY